MSNHLSLTALLICLFLLVLCSAFFSCAETSMMASNRYRLRHAAKHGNRSAQKVETLLRRPDQLLGTILIGNTFANILASSIATLIAARLWGEWGIFISTVALTLVILIFGEVMPKTLAAYRPNAFALILSWPLSLLRLLFYPLVRVVNAVSSLILSPFSINKPSDAEDHLSSEELRTVVDEASGRIPLRHRRMLLRILDLKEMTVDDIMVPRSEIVGIDLNDDWGEILEQLKHAQHTRIPLYEESIEKLIGVIHVRSVVNFLSDESIEDDEHCKQLLREHASEAYFVPHNVPLTTQLLNFQNRKQRSGFVVDEYGDIQGLVTLEDILEEIVGEFTTDMAATTPDVHPQLDGTFLVDGSANIRELNRHMHWDLPTDGPKTVSGLIMEHLETMPVSSICLKINGYPMEVIAMQDQKIKTVRLTSKHP
jgi:Mg2+/Co2+ transporter CorB